MYNMLIVEDDCVIAEEIKKRAAVWGIESCIVTDFRLVMEDFAKTNPQIVLLDISLPFYDGHHWCSEIRKASKVPIIFISSAGDSMNMIMAMNMGADDFVTKPFDADVLMAKIRALLRRTYSFTEPLSVIELKGALLNTADNSLTYKGEKIELSKNEYRILLCLMENRGKVVSREKLMEALWKTDSFVDENTLTVNVNRLRKKLDAAGLCGFIATKFGQGYIAEV